MMNSAMLSKRFSSLPALVLIAALGSPALAQAQAAPGADPGSAAPSAFAAPTLKPLPRIDYVVRDKDVRVLSKPQPYEAGRIELTVFFWYGSPWSAKVDPYLRAWVESGRAPAQLKIDYVPVVQGPEWAFGARIFYALRELGLEQTLTPKLLRAVDQGVVSLKSPRSVSNWLVEQGVAAEKFEQAINSPRVVARLAGLPHIARAYEVRSTPTFVINGQFHIASTTLMPPERATAVALFMVDRLAKDAQASQQP